MSGLLHLVSAVKMSFSLGGFFLFKMAAYAVLLGSPGVISKDVEVTGMFFQDIAKFILVSDGWFLF